MTSVSFAPAAFTRYRISLAEIDAVVSWRLGETRGLGNSQPACFNRQVAMYLARHVGRWSTTVIGRFYNGRDHSIVCYGIQRIEALREINPDVDALVSDLKRELSADGLTEAGSEINGMNPSEKDLERLADLIAARVWERSAGDYWMANRIHGGSRLSAPDPPRRSPSHVRQSILRLLSSEAVAPKRVFVFFGQDGKAPSRKLSTDVTNGGGRGLHGRRIFVSRKKPEKHPSDCFVQDSFSGNGLREEPVNELRAKAEKFCERASLEQIMEAQLIVRSLLAARGLLPEQASKLIN
jgi:hypothetical protein